MGDAVAGHAGKEEGDGAVDEWRMAEKVRTRQRRIHLEPSSITARKTASPRGETPFENGFEDYFVSTQPSPRATLQTGRRCSS